MTYPSNLKDISMDRIGGKAFQLYQLSQLQNVNVPKWSVLDVKWFEQHLSLLPQKILNRVNDNTLSVKDVSSLLQEAIESTLPGSDFELQMRIQLQWFRDNNIPQISIRSSATSEDSDQASHAGQFSSYLHIPLEEETVKKHILKVWASCFSERVLIYQKEKNISPPKMAVVLQEMIPAEVSGVGFSINPTTGNTDEIMISATYGVGEGIVSGKYSGDTFYVSRHAPCYHETLDEKKHMLCEKPEQPGILEEKTVPANMINVPCLEENGILKLKEAICEIQKYFQHPIDIEFAFYKDNFFLLQSRPITTATLEEKTGWGEKILWDNSNIVESYNGITLPLTFSFINFAYQQVYEQFGRMLGISRTVHEENQRLMRTYLGLIQGRVYYNLFTWYKSFQYLPFFKYTSSAMEAMMGLPESVNIKTLPETQQSGGGIFAKGNLIAKCTYYFFNAQKIVNQFQEYFQKNYKIYSEKKYQNYTPQQLLTEFENLDIIFLKNWKAPILADTLAMVFYKALEGLCNKWIGIQGIQNDLLSEQGEVESTEPTLKILEFFKSIRDDDHLSNFIQKHKAKDLSHMYFHNRHQEYDAMWKWLDQYLVDYGSRSINELKLEVPTLSEDPAFIFKTVQNYLENPEQAMSSFSSSLDSRKKFGEDQVREKLKASPLKKKFFNWVLNKAKQHIKNREAMRLARSKVYGLVRRIMVGYGHTLFQGNVIEAPEDIFYLTIPELQAYGEGRSVTQSLNDLVQIRKREYKDFEDNIPDDRFFTVGLPYYKQRYESSRILKNTDGNILMGTCCCVGKLKGKVRVIQDPTGDLRLNGEILVASRTDPGWIPLYPSISGLLIEKGSVLSHSAIVAREMGIPTIVGVDNLLNRIQDGDEVEMDAETGTITLLKEETEGSYAS